MMSEYGLREEYIASFYADDTLMQADTQRTFVSYIYGPMSSAGSLETQTYCILDRFG